MTKKPSYKNLKYDIGYINTSSFLLGNLIRVSISVFILIIMIQYNQILPVRIGPPVSTQGLTVLVFKSKFSAYLPTISNLNKKKYQTVAKTHR